MKADNHFLKDSNGNLSGVLLDSAIALVASYIPEPSADTLAGLANTVLNDWFSMGVTTVFDAGIGVTPIDALVYPRLQPTPMRLRAAVSGTVFTPDTRSSWDLGHQVTAKAVKFWVDGSTQGFTAMLNCPYPNPPPWLTTSPPSPPYANSTELQEAMQPWYDKGYQLSVHSNGDKGTDLVLEAYQNLLKQPPANPDPDVIPTPPFHRIEHVTVVSDEQIHAIAATGKLSVSHTIGHVYYWGASLPPDPRPPRIDPIASDIANGLLWSVHSDSPVTPVTPLLYVRTALTRLTQQNSTLLGGAQRVTDLAAAIKGITVNPAIQLGLFNLPSQGGGGGGEGHVDAMNAKGDQGGDGIVEPAIGSLEVGKQADFVVLGSDPRSVDWTVLDEIPSVKETWIGGVRVFSRILA
ncbi:amidohydrolase family-domain-containing protein [Coprinopsis sp. MPI-PUGE-AT-0042]|nr:amidohydrolase family-domain-containing protein [Coprinopsis sp. MPI-PUGE-AT-0042]